MVRFPDGVSCRVLPQAVLGDFEQLLQPYIEAAATLLNEATVPWQTPGRYWLLVSPSLSLLALCEPIAQTASELPQCCFGLTFEVGAIADFLAALAAQPSCVDRQAELTLLLEQLQPSSPQAQADFTLALMTQLAGHHQQAAAAASRPVQQALDQQLEQSLLLNQVISKIQASLDLPLILQTTVAEVCQFLQADRLLIYQFDLAEKAEALSMGEQNLAEGGPSQARHSGYITYESRASEQVSSVLNYTERFCFDDRPHCRLRYLEGKPFAVDDVQSTYQHSSCLLKFMRQSQVRSKLVAPLLVNQQLWGLLIAHQCSYQRQWQPWELTFLQQIAEHLATAISQAQLYQQLQLQTSSLEACVIERTQNLEDALAVAQSAGWAKSEFLATMSHELRTPLTCIIGMSATLLRWSFGELSDRQRDYLTTIHDSGTHLLALINDILEVSKIESGRTVLEISEFSVPMLARQSLDVYRAAASSSEIDLHLDLKLGSDQDTFVADPKRVRQILSNLLSNAVKFTPTGGRIVLRLRRDPQTLTIQVEDTGIGIAEEQQPLLFEKFQQLESSRQRQYQGTGLGLALTKQLVDLHGGSISVTSQMGMGSVFTVRLPLQRQAGPTPPLASPLPTTEPLVGRIILVEDDDENAGIICDMLTAADYQVVWVIEGSKVLEQVEVLQPSAVIISVTLSDTNGYQIIRSLRRYVGTLGVRVLALVDSHSAEQTQLARQAGADDVLPRPVKPEQLLKTMSALMSLTAS